MIAIRPQHWSGVAADKSGAWSPPEFLARRRFVSREERFPLLDVAVQNETSFDHRGGSSASVASHHSGHRLAPELLSGHVVSHQTESGMENTDRFAIRGWSGSSGMVLLMELAGPRHLDGLSPDDFPILPIDGERDQVLPFRSSEKD